MANSNHIVDVWVARHPHSKANEDDANYGDMTVLSEKGEAQVPRLERWIREKGIDLVVSSTANRTLGTLLRMDLGIECVANNLYNERRRPPQTVGTKNENPETRRLLDEALTHYGEATSLHGEETWFETSSRVDDGLETLLHFARAQKPKQRILLFTHGLLARMYFVRALVGHLDPELYRQAYWRTGFPNAGVMHMWYGPLYGKPDVIDWQVDLGTDEHL